MRRSLFSLFSALRTVVIFIFVAACDSSANGPAEQLPVDTASIETALALVREGLGNAQALSDPVAYAGLHTEGAVFEWAEVPPVVGRTALENFMRENWASRRDIRVTVNVLDLTIGPDRAYEFASYEEQWFDPDGREVVELGRYVVRYILESDNQWRIDRLLGFTDSTSTK